ncbi:retrotransposon hot spot (RHS) protein [Trypanosoma cruzi]|nr:retrotransposon hot spot (RHS) protein [Trypanosoma cruzi]
MERYAENAMPLHNTAGWRRQGAESLYLTLRSVQHSDDPACSLGNCNVVYTVWAFLLWICRGVMWGGIIVEGSTDAAKPLWEVMRGVIPCFLACVVAVMLCVRTATVVELNTVQCVLLTGTAQHMFFVGFPKGGAHRRCVIPATVHYSATVRAAVRCATASLCHL